ncbi:hypothetical protein [Photobacterium frigidiphilum]|uniref:hypothetical protein n=1 Tax=Photobacterium frigidiphilum TaxID=264736 RepID=UPI001475571F|nr:hypothetical protein [Photobacterium frigidiphilum]
MNDKLLAVHNVRLAVLFVARNGMGESVITKNNGSLDGMTNYGSFIVLGCSFMK